MASHHILPLVRSAKRRVADAEEVDGNKCRRLGDTATSAVDINNVVDNIWKTSNELELVELIHWERPSLERVMDRFLAKLNYYRKRCKDQGIKADQLAERLQKRIRCEDILATVLRLLKSRPASEEHYDNFPHIIRSFVRELVFSLEDDSLDIRLRSLQLMKSLLDKNEEPAGVKTYDVAGHTIVAEGGVSKILFMLGLPVRKFQILSLTILETDLKKFGAEIVRNKGLRGLLAVLEAQWQETNISLKDLDFSTCTSALRIIGYVMRLEKSARNKLLEGGMKTIIPCVTPTVHALLSGQVEVKILRMLEQLVLITCCCCEASESARQQIVKNNMHRDFVRLIPWYVRILEDARLGTGEARREGIAFKRLLADISMNHGTFDITIHSLRMLEYLATALFNLSQDRAIKRIQEFRSIFPDLSTAIVSVIRSSFPRSICAFSYTSTSLMTYEDLSAIPEAWKSSPKLMNIYLKLLISCYEHNTEIRSHTSAHDALNIVRLLIALTVRSKLQENDDARQSLLRKLLRLLEIFLRIVFPRKTDCRLFETMPQVFGNRRSQNTMPFDLDEQAQLMFFKELVRVARDGIEATRNANEEELHDSGNNIRARPEEERISTSAFRVLSLITRDLDCASLVMNVGGGEFFGLHQIVPLMNTNAEMIRAASCMELLCNMAAAANVRIRLKENSDFIPFLIQIFGLSLVYMNIPDKREWGKAVANECLDIMVRDLTGKDWDRRLSSFAFDASRIEHPLMPKEIIAFSDQRTISMIPALFRYLTISQQSSHSLIDYHHLVAAVQILERLITINVQTMGWLISQIEIIRTLMNIIIFREPPGTEEISMSVFRVLSHLLDANSLFKSLILNDVFGKFIGTLVVNGQDVSGRTNDKARSFWIKSQELLYSKKIWSRLLELKRVIRSEKCQNVHVGIRDLTKKMPHLDKDALQTSNDPLPIDVKLYKMICVSLCYCCPVPLWEFIVFAGETADATDTVTVLRDDTTESVYCTIRKMVTDKTKTGGETASTERLIAARAIQNMAFNDTQNYITEIMYDNVDELQQMHKQLLTWAQQTADDNNVVIVIANESDSVEIPVSRQLLCNVSEAFARMLNGYFVESSQSRITLEEVTAKCLITFSDFILKAVSCNHVCDVAADTMALDDILGLWSFSDKYIMDYPKQWCERWMLEHIRGNHVRFNEMRILGDILKIYRFFTENFLSGDPINEEKDDGMDTYRIIVKECIKRLILQFGKVVMTNEYEEWIRESKIIDGYYEVEIDIDVDRHENNNDLCNDGPLVFFDQVEQLLLHLFRTVVTTNDLLSIK